MMKATVLLMTALLFQAVPSAGEDSELEGTVRKYWDHLMRHEKVQALTYVTPETQPLFLARQEPPFRSWKLEGIERQGEDAFQVRVVAERLIQDGFYNWQIREDWVRTEGGWKVRIPDQAAARKSIWARHDPLKPEKGLLDLRPAALRLHFFSGSQQGTVLVRNGLPEPVEVCKLDFDRERFELVESEATIPAQSVGKITLRYRGQETAKGLRSVLIMTVRSSLTGERSFEVPISYNVVSRAARALLGLTPEGAQQIRKGDQVAPRRVIPPGIQ